VPALRLKPRDLYRLRRASLAEQRAQAEAAMARQELREAMLEVERRYGIMGVGASLDINTGVITLDDGKEVEGHGPDYHARLDSSGPA
jgi:hypothetical protein